MVIDIVETLPDDYKNYPEKNIGKYDFSKNISI